MKAIVIEGGKGPAEALKLGDVDDPVPGPGQIVIRVAAAGVNRPDLIQRNGFYPPPPGAPPTMGLEVAGEVIHAAGRWKLGDQVCALLGGGGYAELAACDARHALPIPRGLSLIEAAALPETVFTVYANVFEGGTLKAGETLLVHGATSGIGVMAIRMGKAAGAKVIATARGREKADQALKLGADVGDRRLRRGLRGRGQGRRRRRRGAGHGRRAVLREEPGGAEDRRADRLHRRAGRRHDRAADRRADAKARVHHRLDAAATGRRREGAAGGRGRARGLAMDRGGHGEDR